MAPPSVSRPVLRFALVAAAVVASLGASATRVEGQLTLAQAQVAYRQAVAEYEGSRYELEDLSLDSERALERVAATRGTDAEEAARAAYHQTALDLIALERETQESFARVEQTRVAWTRLLEARELEILAQRNANPSSPILGRLADELLEVRALVAELEAEAGLDQIPSLRPVPELVVDPRDGIDDLRAKQDLMEEHVSRYESVIQDIDAEIEELQDDLQRNQSVEDFLRSVQRFGSDLVSGAPLPPPVSDQGADPADEDDAGIDGAVAASLASLPLEERIESLREIRTLAVEYRDQAVQRADTFRALAQGGGP